LELSGQLCSPTIFAQGTPQDPPEQKAAEWVEKLVCTLKEKKKNILLLLGIKPGFLSSPVHSLVTIVTELWKLITTNILHVTVYFFMA
jgi:hypothetical protein